jgi:hypothetical protein
MEKTQFRYVSFTNRQLIQSILDVNEGLKKLQNRCIDVVNEKPQHLKCIVKSWNFNNKMVVYFLKMIWQAIEDNQLNTNGEDIQFWENFDFDTLIQGTQFEKYDFTAEEEEYLTEQENFDLSK